MFLKKQVVFIGKSSIFFITATTVGKTGMLLHIQAPVQVSSRCSNIKMKHELRTIRLSLTWLSLMQWEIADGPTTVTLTIHRSPTGLAESTAYFNNCREWLKETTCVKSKPPRGTFISQLDNEKHPVTGGRGLSQHCRLSSQLRLDAFGRWAGKPAFSVGLHTGDGSFKQDWVYSLLQFPECLILTQSLNAVLRTPLPSLEKQHLLLPSNSSSAPADNPNRLPDHVTQ